jgi:hypothetical protein
LSLITPCLSFFISRLLLTTPPSRRRRRQVVEEPAELTHSTLPSTRLLVSFLRKKEARKKTSIIFLLSVMSVGRALSRINHSCLIVEMSNETLLPAEEPAIKEKASSKSNSDNCDHFGVRRFR